MSYGQYDLHIDHDYIQFVPPPIPARPGRICPPTGFADRRFAQANFRHTRTQATKTGGNTTMTFDQRVPSSGAEPLIAQAQNVVFGQGELTS